MVCLLLALGVITFKTILSNFVEGNPWNTPVKLFPNLSSPIEEEII